MDVRFVLLGLVSSVMFETHFQDGTGGDDEKMKGDNGDNGLNVYHVLMVHYSVSYYYFELVNDFLKGPEISLQNMLISCMRNGGGKNETGLN